MVKTRRRRTVTRRRKQRGGAFDCENEGFTLAMRYATFGREYNINVGHIHIDGESWSFQKLRDFSFNGIVKWYTRQMNTPYSEQDLTKLKENETLAILGAFFHRYKVVAERLQAARRVLYEGLSYLFSGKASMKNLSGVTSYKQFMNQSPQIKVSPVLKDAIEKMSAFVDSDITAKDLAIESAIDKAQCLMFYIVKHKGETPPGFVMDPRIESRAKQPIVIERSDTLKERLGILTFKAALHWFEFLENAYTDLTVPPVTFGVFE